MQHLLWELSHFTLMSGSDSLCKTQLVNVRDLRRTHTCDTAESCQGCGVFDQSSLFDGAPSPPRQAGADSKGKGNNTSGNNAPAGGVAQQCSVCARVRTHALCSQSLLCRRGGTSVCLSFSFLSSWFSSSASSSFTPYIPYFLLLFSSTPAPPSFLFFSPSSLPSSSLL